MGRYPLASHVNYIWPGWTLSILLMACFHPDVRAPSRSLLAAAEGCFGLVRSTTCLYSILQLISRSVFRADSSGALRADGKVLSNGSKDQNDESLCYRKRAHLKQG